MDHNQHKLTIKDETTDFLLYTSPNGEVKVEVLLSGETLWLTQQRMADLFGVQRPAITKHLKNIFESAELEEAVVCSILELPTPHGAIEGKTQIQKVKYYNLNAVIHFMVDKTRKNGKSLATIPARPINDAQIGGLLFFPLLQRFITNLELKGVCHYAH